MELGDHIRTVRADSLLADQVYPPNCTFVITEPLHYCFKNLEFRIHISHVPFR
ncbi:hypothetical protein I1A_003095 [Pseudomonas fluorescens R124]|uniref:Uncharacterized protein n=1 Tax=Pseudomonas fluorescens R124 TaxID=743713 RepID=A0A7U9GT51_PSEFL|nr:hypothetical protein I1A_003095 [Pseudomonas fluorescens R124]